MAFALVFLGLSFGSTSYIAAQTVQAKPVNESRVEQIISKVERQSINFRKSFDSANDRSGIDGTITKAELKSRIMTFETAANELHLRFNNGQVVATDVDNVLNRAALIDEYMRNHLTQPRLQGDWLLLKNSLQQLATAYNVALNLNGRVLPPSVAATQRDYRVTDAQVQTLLNQIETKTDAFRSNLTRSLNSSRFNSTKQEDKINEFLQDFESSTDVLKQNFNERISVEADAANVLVRAARIDDFMKRNLRNDYPVQFRWTDLRIYLNRLSDYYSLAFNLDKRKAMPFYSENGMLMPADARLTGTFKLNVSQSDNPRIVANEATRFLAPTDGKNIYDRLVSRLTGPERIALERHGIRVMLASTIAPQITLEADNREHLERYPNGRPARVRASFSGDTLNVISNGDKMNDFTAVFTPLNNGQRMLVTRRLYAEGLNRLVEVKSYYDQMSERAQFNIFDSSTVNNQTNAGVYNEFLVPDNLLLVGILNTDLSTKTVREGDPFTMVVRSPSRFAGAIIEGYVSDVDRANRISGRSEMTLNYERINWNSRTYQFSGTTREVMTNLGQRLRIDNERAVKKRTKQTNQTIKLTAFGSGVGAVIGATTGANIGDSAGTGSIYLEGTDDLKLMNGTQVTIRASAPRSF